MTDDTEKTKTFSEAHLRYHASVMEESAVRRVQRFLDADDINGARQFIADRYG